MVKVKKSVNQAREIQSLQKQLKMYQETWKLKLKQQKGDNGEERGKCQRYKMTCKTVQRPGEKELDFQLTTPSEAGVSSGQYKRGSFKATVIGLSARPAVFDPVHYSLEMSITFQGNKQVYSSSLIDMFHTDTSSVEKINRKFADFLVRTKKQFPLFTTVPQVRPVASPPTSQMFQVVLPPYTGLYSASEHLWAALRFPPELIMEEEVEDKNGGTKKRYGFANHSGDMMVISSRLVLVATDYPSVMYALVTKTKPTTVTQVEVEFFLASVPQTLAEKKTLDAATAGQALVRLVRSGLLRLNLPEDLLTVDLTTPGRIVLSSQVQDENVAGARVDLGLKITQPLKEYFSLDNTTLTFPSNVARVITLMHKEPALQDVLAGRYPLHLIAPSRPGSHHFVTNFGWVTLLGILSGPSKFLGGPEWVELRDGQTQLQLVLVDRWCQHVVPSSMTEYFLNLELVAL